MDNYSLTDIATATGSRDMLGGNGILILFFLFALMGGNGFGFGGNRQTATIDELSAGFNFSGINNKLNEITSGIAGVNQNIGNAICQSTYELASKIDNCCCTTKEAIGQVRYDMAVQNGELKALIQQNKIEALQAQVNQLQLAQATCGLPRISTNAWGVYPFTCQTGCGYTNV